MISLLAKKMLQIDGLSSNLRDRVFSGEPGVLLRLLAAGGLDSNIDNE